jgi:hypothetical protein
MSGLGASETRKFSAGTGSPWSQSSPISGLGRAAQNEDRIMSAEATSRGDSRHRGPKYTLSEAETSDITRQSITPDIFLELRHPVTRRIILEALEHARDTGADPALLTLARALEEAWAAAAAAAASARVYRRMDALLEFVLGGSHPLEVQRQRPVERDVEAHGVHAVGEGHRRRGHHQVPVDP